MQSSFCTHALGVLSQVGRRTTSSCCRLVDQGCKLHPLTKRREESNKNEKGLMKKNFVIEYFDVVLFMKQKQRRKKKGKRDKNKKQKESKKKDKKEKRKEKERDRERGSEKGGGQKRLGRKKGEH